MRNIAAGTFAAGLNGPLRRIMLEGAALQPPTASATTTAATSFTPTAPATASRRAATCARSARGRAAAE